MTESIRIAIIGCGDIAEHGHLPAILAHPRFRLVGLCDTSVSRLEALNRAAPAVRSVTDYRELLGEADAFVLALHPEVSVAIAIDLLRKGKHVLDEKPLARSLSDAEALKAAVHSAAGTYQVGFVFRYSAFARQISELVQLVGPNPSVTIRIFDERLDRSQPEHLRRMQGILRSSSTITHEGSHFIDLARLWNPEPLIVVASVAFQTEVDLAGPNLWHTTLRHCGGAVLQLQIGWLLPTLPPSNLWAVGSGGWLEAPLHGGEATVCTSSGCEKRVFVPPMRQDWTAQLDCFARSILGQPDLRAAGFDDGLYALTTTLACEAAAGLRRKETV